LLIQLQRYEDRPITIAKQPPERIVTAQLYWYLQHRRPIALDSHFSIQLANMQPEPEILYLPPTRYVPNSKLPVLVYRGVLGSSPTPESIRSQIEPNKWIRGGQWKTYPTAHFHSVSHECYAVFQGKSTFRLGKSPIDPDTNEHGERLGHDVVLERGDIIVLPVSTALLAIVV
jgi:uncharacterized protein YjlB